MTELEEAMAATRGALAKVRHLHAQGLKDGDATMDEATADWRLAKEAQTAAMCGDW
jgi:hypothetical protein